VSGLVAREASVGGVEPPRDPLEPEEFGIDDESEANVAFRRFALQARVALHHLDEVPAMYLQKVVNV
jgi:hypothetical protein